MPKKEGRWVHRWRYLIWSKPIKPGIWRLKTGGYLARVRIVSPATGKPVEKKASHDDVQAAAAWILLTEREIREGGGAKTPSGKIRFYDYTVSLMERKVALGEHKSAATVELWRETLELYLTEFHDLFMDAITKPMIKQWLVQKGKLVREGRFSPRTVNSWLKKLKVIMRAYADDTDSERCPVNGIPPLDESEHETYPKEQPNSLLPEERAPYYRAVYERQPQYYLMTAMGFTYGLRPSSLRPLRYKGPNSDIDWQSRTLLIRRSHTRGQVVMNTTKTGVRLTLPIPQDMLDILRWHVETQLGDRAFFEAKAPGEAEQDALLFPGRKGIRCKNCLLDPFEDVEKFLKLKKHITPRAMRRTYQDLCREASLENIVTRSISGHATESMQALYSTVSRDEQERGLAKVIELAGFRAAMNGVKNGVNATPDAQDSRKQPRRKARVAV